MVHENKIDRYAAKAQNGEYKKYKKYMNQNLRNEIYRYGSG